MVLEGMLKHHTDSSHRHMEARMAVAIPNSHHQRILLMALLPHLKLVSLAVVVRLQKLHLRVDVFEAGKRKSRRQLLVCAVAYVCGCFKTLL
ncbi:hypothetical protein HanIR_Chr05g0233981 [Helianthus annuus]|nr:hypothetical protein HanIR_Chr05g0233981 [Helianthus annuus]